MSEQEAADAAAVEAAEATNTPDGDEQQESAESNAAEQGKQTPYDQEADDSAGEQSDDGDKTFSQKALDAKVAAARREIEGSYKSKLEAAETERDTFKGRTDTLTGERDSLKLVNARLSAAYKAGLPFEWAERLKGDDAEAIQADAEALAKSLPKGHSGFDGGRGEPAPADGDGFNAVLRRAVTG